MSWAFARIAMVSIALPFAFHIWCFPFALICHWISFVFLLYGRRIATHSVDSSLTQFLCEFPGLGLALVPDVVVLEAEQRCAWSRKPDPNFWPGRGRTSDLDIQRPRVLPLDYRAPLLLIASYDIHSYTHIHTCIYIHTVHATILYI